MPRLDKDRQKELEPKRIETALKELNQLNLEVTHVNDTRIDFYFKDCLVQFYPYSGWHTGKSIKNGRGLKNLLKQLVNQ